MLIFTRSLRVCLAVDPVDLRKSFDGLAAQVQHSLEEDERSSQVVNKKVSSHHSTSHGLAKRPFMCWSVTVCVCQNVRLRLPFTYSAVLPFLSSAKTESPLILAMAEVNVR